MSSMQVDWSGVANAIFCHDGRAIFREVLRTPTSSLTLGTMLKGKYRWIADDTEIFHVKAGRVNVSVDDELGRAEIYSAGATFSIEVPPDGERVFWFEVLEDLDYLCEIRRAQP